MNEHNEHYKALGIEPWEIMEKNFSFEEQIGAMKINILKYLMRNKEGVKDYEKLATYANKLVEICHKHEQN